MISECKNTDAGCEIEIPLSIDIIKVHAVPLIQHDRIAVICVEQNRFRLIDICFHAHGFLPFSVRCYIGNCEIPFDNVYHCAK